MLANALVDALVGSDLLLGTFRLVVEDDYDYDYEFFLLSTHTSKNVGLQTLCACSVREIPTRSRPRSPFERSLL